MTDLATLANYAEVIGAGTVVGGVAFAVIQLRNFRQQRSDAAAFEFLQAVQSPGTLKAFRTVLSLPEGLSAEQLRARGPEVVEAVNLSAWAMENVGVLVHQRILDLRTVDLLLGGFIRESWARVGTYIRDERRVLRNEPYSEWFQWLAERLEEHGDPRKKEGAHRLYADWTP